MSEQAQEQDLTSSMQQMMAQMARMQEELDSLKARVNTQPQPQPQPTIQSKPEVSTTRRKLLRRLAGGLVAGLAVGGIGVSLPQQAEAKFVAAKGWGAIVMPPGGTLNNTNAPTGTVYGLYATSDAYTNIGNYLAHYKIGVVGLNTETASGSTYFGVFGQARDAGVRGESDIIGVWGLSTNGTGVWGDSTYGIGVHGQSTNSFGVYGKNFGGAGTAGVYGSGPNIGVLGEGGTGGVGLYGKPGSGQTLGAHIEKNCQVDGSLFAAAKPFKIDHPLDPENKYLHHIAIESPDMKNLYDGVVTLNQEGQGIVEMPNWFEALNFDFRYQLTCLGQYAPVFIAEKIQERIFKIAGGQPGQEVSWQVTGIRQDAWAKTNRIPVEEDKNDKEKGFYLHPEAFGKSEEMSVNTLVKRR